ncbi:MAG: hypothetical protein ACE5KW_03715 [Dehalococcoidia bacterium]
MNEAVPQIVDAEAARDFMQETLERITPSELEAIAGELEEKSDSFNGLLSPTRLPSLSEEDLRKTMRSIFVTRRRIDTILGTVSVDGLRQHLQHLLYGDAPIAERFQSFSDALAPLDESFRFDLASEYLHFTLPDRYWLWTRWMWDPNSETGSLPLVTLQEFDLHAPSLGEMYEKVGMAVAFVDRTREAIDGYRQIGHGVFGTDVYLACVYSIYVYTVLKMRMTKEFTKVIPELAGLTRRLLGVQQKEV